MRLSARLLKLFGWTVDISVPIVDKCVICVAPHTSNWDFILGILAYDAVGRRANFLMKEGWFFFPLKYLFKAMGGIPVPAVKGAHLTDVLAKMMSRRKTMHLAVTPEGTRSRNTRWRKGFLVIAADAHVPVEMGVIDYKKHCITIADTYIPTGNIAKDMSYVRSFYTRHTDAAMYPDKFALPD